MGLGDWLIATAQAKRLHEANGRPVLVVGITGKPQWSDVFINNPRIIRTPTRNCQRLVNAGGMRPYIAGKSPTHWVWRKWSVSPGELFLTRAEIEFAQPHAGYVLIEPNTKFEASNKEWPFDRWQALVDRGGKYIQVGTANSKRLRGVCFVETANFRLACAVLAVSRAFVGSEGGLHHAAAALGVPAVVLFSEFIGPEITGYPMHKNIRHAGRMCGARLPCAGCKASMEAISVEEVALNLEQIL